MGRRAEEGGAQHDKENSSMRRRKSREGEKEKENSSREGREGVLVVRIGGGGAGVGGRK